MLPAQLQIEGSGLIVYVTEDSFFTNTDSCLAAVEEVLFVVCEEGAGDVAEVEGETEGYSASRSKDSSSAGRGTGTISQDDKLISPFIFYVGGIEIKREDEFLGKGANEPRIRLTV